MNYRPTSQQSGRSKSSRTGLPLHLSNRLAPSFPKLVNQVTGLTLEADPENFGIACDFVPRYLEHPTSQTTLTDLAAMEQRIRGFAERAQINMQDNLADALQRTYDKLKFSMQDRTELDTELKISSLPNLLQFLFELSSPPKASTLAHADILLANVKEPQLSNTLTWETILAEEPFEGEHWEGAYGIHVGSVINGHTKGEQLPNSPSISSLEGENVDSDGLEHESLPSLGEDSDHFSIAEPSPPPATVQLFLHDTTDREGIEDLNERQYWRPGWQTDANLALHFNPGDASTLGPAITRIFAGSTNLLHAQTETFINESDVVRDILRTLQGQQTCIMDFKTNDDGYVFEVKVLPDAPRLVHLTLTSYHSILSKFAAAATTLQHLRQFVSSVYHCQQRQSQALEAFAESLHEQLREFDIWAAGREEEISKAHLGCRGPLIVSLLSLERDLRGIMAGTFDAVYDILVAVLKRAECLIPLNPILLAHEFRVPIANLTTYLLDETLSTVQVRLSIGDAVTAFALIRIFGQTAEPLWTSVGHWLRHGMNVSQSSESEEGSYTQYHEGFFICRNDVNVTAPEFWATGYTLRTSNCTDNNETNDGDLAPRILSHVAVEILATGKAVGLLRALGDGGLFGDGEENQWLSSWSTFQVIVNEATADVATSNPDVTQDLTKSVPSLRVSTDSLELLIYDRLIPLCRLAQLTLKRVLVDDCELWKHLKSIEDVYLMRKADSLAQFCDVLFSRMDTRQSWTDFHFLNTTFRDVTTGGRNQWVDPSLVRFSFRAMRERPISRTIRGFESLVVEYAVPFPLNYLFGPVAIQVYSSIFVFLFQIRRVKTVIESILIRGVPTTLPGSSDELKPFYALRGKFQWFINTLINFVVTNVLQVQIEEFHRELEQATSLDDMISKHDIHLEKIRGRCLLNQGTSAIHRAVLSIFDLALHFSDCFSAFAGDATHDISRLSLVTLRKKRRRRRRQLPNVIGFVTPKEETSDESDDDDNPQLLIDRFEPSSIVWGPDTSISFVDEGFFIRLDKISTELDDLVRFIRRGVESLSARTSDAASAMGMFAFALEDWDI